MSRVIVKEIWKDVVGYEGLYQVNNLGNIESLFRYKKILKPKISNAGYLRVDLFKNKTGKWFSVHRLVALAFIPNVKGKEQINHKDEIKTNNSVENLEWVTQRENNIYGTSRERMVKNTDYSKRKSFDQSERTKSFEKPVCQYDKKGNFIKLWKSASEYMREINKTTASNISLCCKGTRKSAYGFTWKFQNDGGYGLSVE